MDDYGLCLSYSLATAATKLGISESTLRRIIKDKDIPLVKIRNRTVIRHSDLETLLEIERS